MGHVVVDDQSYLIDIDTSRNYIGSHQNIDFVVFEIEHDRLALGLFQIGVHGCHLVLFPFECESQLLHLLLRRREDDGLRAGGLSEKPVDNSHLLILVADVGRLVDSLVGLRNSHIHLYRIVHDILGQLANLGRHGGREHDGLPLGGQAVAYLHDVVVETHVEHAVGLIENKILDARKINIRNVQVRDEPPRCGDNDIGTQGQPALLLFPRRAVAPTRYHSRGDGQEIGETGKLHVDLLSQFTSRCHNNRPHLVAAARILREQIQQRQDIGSRLARTGLGTSNQISSLQYHGNGLFLHRGSLLKVHGIKPLHNLFRQSEFFKCHIFLLKFFLFIYLFQHEESQAIEASFPRLLSFTEQMYKKKAICRCISPSIP